MLKLSPEIEFICVELNSTWIIQNSSILYHFPGKIFGLMVLCKIFKYIEMLMQALQNKLEIHFVCAALREPSHREQMLVMLCLSPFQWWQ